MFREITMGAPVELDPKADYIGGVDGAEGLRGGDRHSFAVIDHKAKPARVAFEMTTDDPLDVFDLRVAEMCRKYHIKLMVESNGVGVAHCQKFKELGVSFKEWDTTAGTRPVMIVELEEAYRKGELVETYPEAQNELMDMYYDNMNRPTHPAGRHDDRVFARAIAWQARKQGEVAFRFI